MGVISIFILAIGLSFDTFAVSITCGLIDRHMLFRQAARIAAIFAVFQSFMPLVGWLAGFLIKDYIINIDHWIAFVLLSFIGVKMIYESFKKDEIECFDPHNLKNIVLLSLATTIDALIAGITFAFINVNIPVAAGIIAFVTFVFAMLGMLFGKKIGARLGKKMELVGGLILILIGVKILLEHLNIINFSGVF